MKWLTANNGRGPHPGSLDPFERRIHRWLRQQRNWHRGGGLSIDQVGLLAGLDVGGKPALFDPDRVVPTDLGEPVDRTGVSLRAGEHDDGGALGRTIAELAEQLQVAPTTMWRWSRQVGLPPSLGYRANRSHDFRMRRGRPAEIWDLRQVQAWRTAQLTARQHSTAIIDQMPAAARSRHQRQAHRVDAMIRRLRADGQLLATIAVDLGVAYGRVRRVTADQPRPPTARPVRRRQRWTDSEIVDALTSCGPASVLGYNAWRSQQQTPRPSPATIIGRYGGWSQAASPPTKPSRR